MAEIVLAHASERSVLDNAEARGLVPYRLGKRQRYATCSGVAWFGRYDLAVVNLYGGHLRFYRFQPPDEAAGTPARLALLQEVNEGLSYPEDVAVSPDGKLLAITHSMSDDHGISIHPLDGVSPGPGRMVRRGRTFHAVAFSPDSRHLAVAELGTPGAVEVMRLSPEPVERTCLMENPHGTLKPKGIAFSPDGRFVTIARSQGLSPAGAGLGAMFSVHRYDMARGLIEVAPVCDVTGVDLALASVEMCTFLPMPPGRPYRVLGANQVADTVTALDFDAARSRLTIAGTFAAGLSFPHGIDATADGRFVAITNYGDDSLRIARVAHSD